MAALAERLKLSKAEAQRLADWAGSTLPEPDTAEAVLAEDEFLPRSADINRRGVAQLTAAFAVLGLEWIPSAGNFVTVKVGDAAAVNQSLLRQGVIVRPIAGSGMPHWLRVSIRLPEENARFIEALRQALA
mgnify:CR=1 FL=1